MPVFWFIIGVILTANLPIAALAQVNNPIEAPDALAEEKVPVNPLLQARTQKAVKESMRVKETVEDLIIVKTPPKIMVSIGTYMMFMRPKKEGMDVIGRGRIEAAQGNLVYVRVQSSEIEKIPLEGDLAIPLAAPWSPKDDDKDPPITGVVETEEPPIPGDPGHLELSRGLISGALSASPSDQTNAYKKPTYLTNYTHFEWYLEFAWHVGFEFESISGSYPTYSYDREEEQTDQSISNFLINYRLRKKWTYFRPTFRLVSTSEIFKTTNSDEHLISTQTSGIGLGTRLALEFSSNVWVPKTNDWPITFHQLYADLTVFPSISAKDIDVSRGTSSGSYGYGWRLGAQGLIYLDFIPFIKRFVLTGFYGQRTYNLKFSGATTDPSDGFYTIPENTSTTESNSYWMVSLGIRLDDLIGRFFMPR